MIGALQDRHGLLRPVCFYSAYEAATSFMIGQRISMTQTRRIKDRLAAMAGDPVAVEAGGEQRTFRPFPRPQAVAELADVPGLAAVKVERLRGLARAALDGRLDTERLRALPVDEALAALRTLPGIGEWTASGVLARGCGVADMITLPDRISRDAVRHFYGLAEVPGRRGVAGDRRGLAPVPDVGDGAPPPGVAPGAAGRQRPRLTPSRKAGRQTRSGRGDVADSTIGARQGGTRHGSQSRHDVHPGRRSRTTQTASTASGSSRRSTTPPTTW